MDPNAIQNPTQTIIVGNLSAILSRIPNGDMNSGLARYQTTSGINPFNKINVLSFMETARDITGGIITDLIVAAKERIESGIIYIYAVGNTGRIYKIQVNNPSTHNPDYDTPVLLTTMTTNSPTFNYGGSIEFYSGYIFIGSDIGVTRLDFAGTGETFVGSTGSWVQNVPRPVSLFIGNIYFGNGTNIAEITSGLTVTSYTKLSPGFPAEYQVRDLDVSADGVYLVMTVVRTPLGSITATTADTTSIGAIDSEAAYWNGVNTGATTFLSYPNYAQSSYKTFGPNEFLFGDDPLSATLATPQGKLLTLENAQNPLPNAISSMGNLIVWIAPENNGTKLIAAIHAYGQFDQETSPAHYRLGSVASTLSGTGDVLKVPLMIPVSNYSKGGANSGYTNSIVGTGKIYFSTIEYNGSSTRYGFYAFSLYPTGSGTSIGGIYETLAQLFKKKVVCKEVRVYLEPAVAGQSFQIDIVGIDGNVLSDSSGNNVFTEGATSLPASETLAWYNPECKPSAAVGFRITNLGTVTPYIHKVELDVVPQGK